jgi:hypothetical protein
MIAIAATSSAATIEAIRQKAKWLSILLMMSTIAAAGLAIGARMDKSSTLTVLADVNALGQKEPAMYGHDMEVYRRKFDSKGRATEITDGHDVAAVLAATTGGRLITVEDHWAKGGISEAVLSGLAQAKCRLCQVAARCGRCRTPASRISSLTPSAFRQGVL